MSERRACTIVAADRKMIRYRSGRPPDTELRARLRDLANQRRRFGYRRLFILLRDQGQDISVTELCRECPHLGETLAEEIALYKRFEPPDSAQARRPEPPVKDFAGLRYQPVRYHAQGGLGVVFVARDTEVGRYAATLLAPHRAAPAVPGAVPA